MPLLTLFDADLLLILYIFVFTASSTGVNFELQWLLPVIKTSATAALGKRPHLKFFQERVLDVARRCATKVGGKKASNYDDWVIGLWGLFPCFCQHPVDMQEHLEKLVPTLIKAMEDSRYPQLLVSRVHVFGTS